uniref:Uncharacterized protein n=1 Tax=Chromera velia CCMP2878 TaxID=1169474 RepID=A0A0G4F4Q4_9ALVE|eukprot:Cvel_15197.t1-p1 / transcript=Cvel_15197.t1 / gene=Cvel_15197 / organism=Chromera_velia_CCMP2878 / gene_product=U3 small nucleolar ribonucleoprotein protein MPP10, putative / transcript_product=U3 small nucleolar ribonucleoprotein protein MPP10, putative / location=Cvel_scaffold1111:12417-24203(+) / protein_length=801 / sequence_SO=supercontig / SO=protein_coding / is_pseudo=false
MTDCTRKVLKLLEKRPFLDKVSKEPELLLSETSAAKIGEEALSFAKNVFDIATSVSDHLDGFGDEDGLGETRATLCVGEDFDMEQIWAQIEEHEESFGPKLKREVLGVIRRDEKGDLEKEFLDEDEEDEEEEQNDEDEEEEEGEEEDEESDEDEEEEEDEEELENGGKKGAKMANGKPKRKSVVDDEFFSLEEMEEFAQEGEDVEERARRREEDEDEDEDEEDEDGDELDDEARALLYGMEDGGVEKEKGKQKVKYSELWGGKGDSSGTSKDKGDKKKRGEEDSEEDEDEEEDEEEEGEGEELDAEERELERQLQEMQKKLNEEEEGDEEDEEDQDGDEEMGVEDEEEEEEESEEEEKGKGQKAKKKVDGETGGTSSEGTSLAALDAKERQLHDMIEAMESELLADKHWTMGGEAGARERPLNSLLETHVDLPRFVRRAEEQTLEGVEGLGEEEEGGKEGGGGAPESKVSEMIEKILRQRIKDLNFDDVVRKAGVRPAERTGEEDDGAEILDFQKSRVGLADVYAAEFEKEILGQAAASGQAETPEMKAKRETVKLFAKVMHRLDALSAASQLAKLPKEGARARDVAAIRVEEAIPVTMSMGQQQAPEEFMAPDALKKPHEMSQEERQALRRAKKERRKARLRTQLESGSMSLKGAAERAEKLQTKNKAAREDREAIKESGQTAAQKKKEAFKLQRKVTGNQLLAEASRRSNEDAQRQQERKRRGGAPDRAAAAASTSRGKKRKRVHLEKWSQKDLLGAITGTGGFGSVAGGGVRSLRRQLFAQIAVVWAVRGGVQGTPKF